MLLLLLRRMQTGTRLFLCRLLQPLVNLFLRNFFLFTSQKKANDIKGKLHVRFLIFEMILPKLPITRRKINQSQDLKNLSQDRQYLIAKIILIKQTVAAKLIDHRNY